MLQYCKSIHMDDGDASDGSEPANACAAGQRSDLSLSEISTGEFRHLLAVMPVFVKRSVPYASRVAWKWRQALVSLISPSSKELSWSVLRGNRRLLWITRLSWCFRL